MCHINILDYNPSRFPIWYVNKQQTMLRKTDSNKDSKMAENCILGFYVFYQMLSMFLKSPHVECFSSHFEVVTFFMLSSANEAKFPLQKRARYE